MKYDKDFYTKLFYDLFISYEIKINSEYQFIYDEFLEHLIIDAKNTNNFCISETQMFKGVFYNNLSTLNWYKKIKFPDTSPELKKRLRCIKLQKLNEDKIR